MMSAADVLHVLDLLDDAGVEAWLDGGWGVDALLGEQTRPHDDLDLAIRTPDDARYRAAMESAGFTLWRDDGPYNYVLADAAGRKVDVHLVDLASTRRDERGVEVYGPDGIGYEVGAFKGAGRILGREVGCCTAEFQVRSHDGYELDADDHRDVLALQRRFGIPGARERVRDWLLLRARRDPRVTGAAVTGSAARGEEDEWSDVDLFFGVADVADASDSSGRSDVPGVLAEWSEFVYGELGALHHFDLPSGSAVYRVFLLPDQLELDLGFAPAADFGPVGSGEFRVVFGEPAARRDVPVDLRVLAGYGWHHVLHARICVERGRLWQAVHWINAVRDQAVALACLRLGLPTEYAKGAHLLPAEVTGPLADSLVRTLEAEEARRALAAATRAFLEQLNAVDGELARSLENALRRAIGY